MSSTFTSWNIKTMYTLIIINNIICLYSILKGAILHNEYIKFGTFEYILMLIIMYFYSACMTISEYFYVVRRNIWTL